MQDVSYHSFRAIEWTMYSMLWMRVCRTHHMNEPAFDKNKPAQCLRVPTMQTTLLFCHVNRCLFLCLNAYTKYNHCSHHVDSFFKKELSRSRTRIDDRVNKTKILIISSNLASLTSFFVI